MFQFGPSRAQRRISLTPMIDVVFLLLIFFMLVARFGLESAQPLTLGTAGGDYAGPPRLVDITPDGLRLNGIELAPRPLLLELVRLTESGADTIVLRPVEGADVQRLISVMDLMERAGFTNLAVVEGP